MFNDDEKEFDDFDDFDDFESEVDEGFDDTNESDDDFEDVFEFESRYVTPDAPITADERFLKYEYAEDLAKEIVLSKNCRYFCLINGSFYFGDFIEALIKHNNLHVKEMTVSTLSLNQNNVDSFGNLLHDGYLNKLNLIVSDFFFAHERQTLIPYMFKELDIDNKFQLAAARSHTKICLFETMHGSKVVIHGSANLRTSDNLEQFALEENPKLYDFNYKWHRSILEKYPTIDKKAKSLRGKLLWQTVKKDAPKRQKPNTKF